MSALANPLMIPGASNPSGSSISMPAPFSGSTGVTQTNPYSSTVSPSTTGGAAPNPYASSFGAYGFTGQPSTTTPAPVGGTTNSTSPLIAAGTGQTPGAGGTGSGSGSLTNNPALTRNLDKTFGAGIGGVLQQFLASGAGYNPQVLQQMIAQLQPGFTNQQQNLLQQFSAGGNRFGSGAQTGYADLLGQQSQTEGSMASQLYEQSITNYMNILEDAGNTTATRIENTPSTFDDIMQGVSAAGSVAGAFA
jgi:hypothetical protein